MPQTATADELADKVQDLYNEFIKIANEIAPEYRDVAMYIVCNYFLKEIAEINRGSIKELGLASDIFRQSVNEFKMMNSPDNTTVH